MASKDMKMARSEKSVNRVREQRLSRGWTQSQLGDRAGVSRSAITAIEAGSLSPSVAAALALARVFAVTVEELFGESQDGAAKVWAWVPPRQPARAWQAEVNGRQIFYPATASTASAELPDWMGEEPSHPHPQRSSETLVVATCDPAAGLLARYFHATTGMRMLVLARSSAQSLAMLEQGLVHVAGLHLSTADDPQRNALHAHTTLRQSSQLLRIAQWQEGIAVSPKAKLRSVGSVLKSKLTWVGRDADSAAGQCLQRLMDGRTLPQRMAQNHRGVAEAIQSGWAALGICHQLVADELGLDFLPVQEEAYDVCYHSAMAEDRRIKALITVVRSPAYRQLLQGLPGFDTSQTGTLSTVDA